MSDELFDFSSALVDDLTSEFEDGITILIRPHVDNLGYTVEVRQTMSPYSRIAVAGATTFTEALSNVHERVFELLGESAALFDDDE